MSAGYTRKMVGARNGAGGHPQSRAAGDIPVAHYIRISTEEQKTGYSTRDQRRRLQEYSERENHNVVDVIVEEGDSGANPFRAGVERILELAKAGAIREVWTTERDRFFRRRLYRLQLDEDLKDLGVALRALDDTGNRFVDAIKDEYAEEEREVIRERTRAGRIERARQGEVVAGAAPYGFRFAPDRKYFEVEGGEAAVVRKIFSMAASGTCLSGTASALTAGGVPTPRGERGAKGTGDGKTWSRLVIRQMVLSDRYLPHSPADLQSLVQVATLDPEMLERLGPRKNHSVWWFNRERVEVRYTGDGKTCRFEDNPREEWVAVPVPDAGVPREHVEEVRRRVLSNRASSNAGRRFWELSGAILFCPCGRKMAAHTANRGNGSKQFKCVCGLRRSNHRRCEHGARYHHAEDLERKVRADLLRFLSRPEEVRRRAEEYVASPRRRLARAGRELTGWEGASPSPTKTSSGRSFPNWTVSARLRVRRSRRCAPRARSSRSWRACPISPRASHGTSPTFWIPGGWSGTTRPPRRSARNRIPLASTSSPPKVSGTSRVKR